MVPKKPTVNDVLQKYGSKIETQISGTESPEEYSQAYSRFRGEMHVSLTRYERLCKSFGNFIKLDISQKDKERIQKYIDIAHLDIEPWQSMTFSIMSFLGVFLIGLLISVAITLIGGGFDSFPFLFFFLTLILSVFLFYMFDL